MTAATRRRLPGFAFETRAPVIEEVLPRMDVAAFAGFAASGPLHLPVAVEDAAQFVSVFGADAPLAWDAHLGRMVYAQLGPAVRLFFANGGRRCWVTRLAGAAKSNLLPVPGIAVVVPPGASVAPQSGTILPLELVARSPGSWSDGVALAASLTSRRFGVLGWRGDPGQLSLLGAELALESGDLLRLSWRALGIEMYAAVTSVVGGEGRPSGSRRVSLRVSTGETAWFRTMPEEFEAAGAAWIGGDRVLAQLEPPATSPSEDDLVTLALDISLRRAPLPGEVVIADFGGERLLLAVREVLAGDEWGSPSEQGVRVRGKGLWQWDAPDIPAAAPAVERLRLDLWARATGDDLRGAGADVRPIGDLGLAPGHRRHVQSLPLDDAVYAPDSADLTSWQDVIVPRFPAAGKGAPGLCIPFGVGVLPESYLPARIALETALERDGLVPFDARLFADEALAGSFTTTLLADAEYLRFLAPDPRPQLLGIHAAIPLEEPTLIAVPDASQPDWVRVAVSAPPISPPAPREPPPPCIDDDFVDCISPLQLSPEAEPPAGDEPPLLPRLDWRVRRPEEYKDEVLVAVHRLLLRLCAARRDVMAVLSLPEHYREEAVAAHARHLTSQGVPQLPLGSASAPLVPPLSAGEADAPGFAALYHGWVHARDERGAVRAVAPDGAACGVIARRANERGAWVAPANEVLRGVIALERPTALSEWFDLLQLNVNVVRQDPRGFLVMSADTLASDDDVRPINVRRLLILLRRAATSRGWGYVFEPNDDALRRMVQRGFEALLGDMFQRGAFAGNTAASAFQVVAGETLNTPPSIDQGRFIVELRVAPSRPMAFLTLRLVQVGDRLAVSGV